MPRWTSILIAGTMWVAGGNLRATEVGLIKINGAIGPATASYISRAIDVAAGRHDTCLIIQLNTPGGLLGSTQATTAEKALGLGVIDLIAKDVPDLLQKLDGRTAGDMTLKTAKAEMFEIHMTAGERSFQMLWRPEVMFILMLIVIYGLIGELS